MSWSGDHPFRTSILSVSEIMCHMNIRTNQPCLLASVKPCCEGRISLKELLVGPENLLVGPWHLQETPLRHPHRWGPAPSPCPCAHYIGYFTSRYKCSFIKSFNKCIWQCQWSNSWENGRRVRSDSFGALVGNEQTYQTSKQQQHALFQRVVRDTKQEKSGWCGRGSYKLGRTGRPFWSRTFELRLEWQKNLVF